MKDIRKEPFTAAELEELARADAEIEAGFRLTSEELHMSRGLDRAAMMERMDEKQRHSFASKKAYRAANKERIAERKRTYREANKEKITAYKKAYREANKEKIAAYKRAYRAANKERKRAVCNGRGNECLE